MSAFRLTRRLAVSAAISGLLVAGVAVAAGGAQGARGDTAAAVGRCHSSQLALFLGRGGVATGSVGQVLTFVNRSTSSCTLYGYPGFQMLGAKGQKLTTRLHHGAAFTFPRLPKRLVTLAHGEHASFEVGYADGTGYGTDTCPTATTVQITPPNAYKPITLHWRFAAYGGHTIQTLRCGEITVSPVYPGTGSA